MNAVCVGAGVFGVCAALELVRRGHSVTLLDPGPLPHPDAASTDLSKAVRFDYGDDLFFTELAELCLTRWEEWSARWLATTDSPVFHRDGFLFLTREEMAPGTYEYQSFELLSARGWELERLDAPAIRRRYPMFSDKYVAGYLNPHAGWVESERVVACLLREARGAGVTIRGGGRVRALLQSGADVEGVVTEDGTEHRADVVVVAAGSWTPYLLPWLASAGTDANDSSLLRCVGQSVFYLEVPDPDAWRAPRLMTWAADIARTGWYGFPADARGIVKVANHGPGRRLGPDDSREVLAEEEEYFRAFLAASVPALARAPIHRRRVCPYCDTFDGAFLIDYDPQRNGLFVASGGSGHAFKFAPILGELIADGVEQRPNRWLDRFRWREPGASVRSVESARRS